MKILFLTYHGFEKASGISKKMLAQIKGLRQTGHEVHVCFYDITPQGDRCRYVDGKVIKNYGKSFFSSVWQRMNYSCVADFCKTNAIELVYVRSFMNASPFTIHLFKRLKLQGQHCVMEIPTYPYDKEFESLPLKYKFEHLIDKMFRRCLASYMDAIVTFSDEKQIFGQRTINISNGVDPDTLPLQPVVDTSKEIHLIGVAEVHPWHGYDRLIAGLGQYYSQFHICKPVYFHVVGGVPDVLMEQFIKIINEYHIEKYVIFHGKLFGEELNDVFAQCAFGVGSLGRHRSGITCIKTLKNREYACRGIPFIYSECDSDFDNQPYVLKAPANELPINIQSIIDFVANTSLRPLEIRKTVEPLRWKNQMIKVVDALSSYQ
ncbi:MAG: glycosyltransferase family 1 protein [Prevotella sp.]|nr:glycosyltransferase family 1 protein [Prevotella sp.]